MSPPIRAWAATHAGAVRSRNQDACLCRPEAGLFAVADGVGGQGDGGIAALAVAAKLGAIPAGLAPGALLAAIRTGLQDIHAELLERGAALAPPQTLATTVVVLMLHDNHFACLWVGDSRAYLLRDRELQCLTRDHSVVQDLLDAGAITADEAERDPRRHVITRAVGAGERDLQVQKVVGHAMAGDRFLLCSDGLYKTVADDAVARMLGGAEDVAENLVQAALARRARDNVTAVIAALPTPSSP